MSLLGSIFGDGSKEEKGNLSGLFQKSTELPERPHHAPVAKSLSKRKAKEEDVKEEPEKKKRKKRKSKKIDGKDIGNEVKDSAEGTAKEEEKSEEKDQKPAAEEKTVFVGNLPLATTTRKSLASLFKDCGAVASTRIRSVPVTGVKLPPTRAGDQNLMKKVCANTKQVDDTLKSTVSGYVVFKNIESVEKALEKNNTNVEGLRIRVDRASPTVDPSRSVFIGNLPYGAEEATLQQHFVKGCALDAGDVLGVRIVRDKETHQCKGFGYVLFREKNMVTTALKLHGSKYMKKELRVQVCGKRFKGKKGDYERKFKTVQEKEKVTVGAFRRVLSKQKKEASEWNKRKRGQKKSVGVKKSPGISKRAALDKKVDQRVKKLQKRVSKGMGKARR